MRQVLISTGVLFWALLAGVPATAQEVVHALSGSVVSTDSKAKTITLKTNDGSEGVFSLSSIPNTPLNFDRDVRDHATAAASFNGKPGTQVILYFIGEQSVRTAVALQDLGSGPLAQSTGAVTKFNKHEHLLTVKDAAGKSQSFHIDPKAVADTADGVVVADRFEPEKGDDLRIIAQPSSSGPVALFLREQ